MKDFVRWELVLPVFVLSAIRDRVMLNMAKVSAVLIRLRAPSLLLTLICILFAFDLSTTKTRSMSERQQINYEETASNCYIRLSVVCSLLKTTDVPSAR